MDVLFGDQLVDHVLADATPADRKMSRVGVRRGPAEESVLQVHKPSLLGDGKQAQADEHSVEQVEDSKV